MKTTSELGKVTNQPKHDTVHFFRRVQVVATQIHNQVLWSTVSVGGIKKLGVNNAPYGSTTYAEEIKRTQTSYIKWFSV